MSQNNEFYIGQIFETTYPPEAAAWCNDNNATIIELEDNTYKIITISELYKPSEARALKDAEVPSIILKMNEQGVYYDAVDTTFPTTTFAVQENLLVGQTIAEGSNDYWITTIDGSQKKLGVNNYMQLQNRIKSHYNNVRKAGIAYRVYLRTLTTSEEILAVDTEAKMQEIYQST